MRRSGSLVAMALMAGLSVTNVVGARPFAQSTTLVYVAELGNRQIYTFRIGELPTRVTAEPTENSFNAALSPDGARIAFDRGRDIYVVQRDGTRLRRLTKGRGYNFEPRRVRKLRRRRIRG